MDYYWIALIIFLLVLNILLILYKIILEHRNKKLYEKYCECIEREKIADKIIKEKRKEINELKNGSKRN